MKLPVVNFLLHLIYNETLSSVCVQEKSYYTQGMVPPAVPGVHWGLKTSPPKIREGYVMSEIFKVRDSPSTTQRPTHAPFSSPPKIWGHPRAHSLSASMGPTVSAPCRPGWMTLSLPFISKHRAFVWVAGLKEGWGTWH